MNGGMKIKLYRVGGVEYKFYISGEGEE